MLNELASAANDRRDAQIFYCSQPDDGWNCIARRCQYALCQFAGQIAEYGVCTHTSVVSPPVIDSDPAVGGSDACSLHSHENHLPLCSCRVNSCAHHTDLIIPRLRARRTAYIQLRAQL